MSLDSASTKKGVTFSEGDNEPRSEDNVITTPGQESPNPEAEKKTTVQAKVAQAALPPLKVEGTQKTDKKKQEEENRDKGKKDRDNSTPQSPGRGVSQKEVETSILRKTTVKLALCECGCNERLTATERANHRDRIRSVNVSQRTVTWLQRYIALPTIDVFFWLISNIFFREVDVVGAENIPKDGAVVFFANHQNQFIDAVMLRSLCQRQCRFIIAEKSLHRPVVGHVARLMNSVPVVRPQDVPVETGVGKLNLVVQPSDDMMNMVRGDGTKFNELKHGDVVIWQHPTTGKKCQAQVFKIDNDNQFQATTPICEADRPEDGTTVNFKFSRRIDQSEMYAEVYSTLEAGHTIGIFPEGGSHDRTSLQPLKAGVALFTLGAAERGIHTKIVPVGLTYMHGHRFRSKVHVQFGEPVLPPEELVEQFKADKRKATSEFLDVLNAALKSVTINVTDWPTLKFLHAFRRLYQPADVVLDTRNHLSLTRRLSILIMEHEEDPEFLEFRGKVENHMDYCAALLIGDSQAATLGNLSKSNGVSLALLARRLLAITVMGLVLLPYYIIASPVGLVASALSEDHSKTALAASSVKVSGQDVKASYKIITCMLLIPLCFSLISMIAFFVSDLRTAVTVWCSLPMMMYVSLLISQEFVMEIRAALPLMISILSKHRQFVKVYNGRQKLVNLAKDIVEKHDPKLTEELAEMDKIDTSAVNHKTPSLFSLRHNHGVKKDL